MSPSGVPASGRFCAGFSDAGNADLSARTVAGVGGACTIAVERSKRTLHCTSLRLPLLTVRPLLMALSSES
jgi:hypothetical protein